MEEDQKAVEEQLKDLFDKYDKGKVGKLTSAQLNDLLHEVIQNVNFDEDNCKEWIPQICQSPEGTINFEGVVNLYTELKRQLEEQAVEEMEEQQVKEFIFWI
jgi:Ca2+-binding EF-hand superfamily protein